jgi:hypothetical protein
MHFSFWGGRGGRDRMVIRVIATHAISDCHYLSCEFEPRSWRGVLDKTLCDKAWQWLATCRCFSPGTPVSSNNKTNRHNIIEILLKVTLNTILTLTLFILRSVIMHCYFMVSFSLYAVIILMNILNMYIRENLILIELYDQLWMNFL